MSSRLATIVWDHYPKGGGELLTALALAEHGDPDGTNIYPSIRTIADMTRQSRRTIQNHIDRMMAIGWLVKEQEGGGRGNTTRYRIPIELIPQDVRLKVQKLHRLDVAGSSGTDSVQNLHPLAPVNGAETVQKRCRNGAAIVAPDLDLRPVPTSLKPSCAEPPSDSPPFLVIPLVGKQGEFTVTDADVTQWQESFPGIDVRQLLRKIRQWNIDNPAKRKTKSGIRGHISRWLGKEQDTHPTAAGPSAKPVDTSCRRQLPGTNQICGMPGKPHPVYKFSCEHCNLKDREARQNREIPPGVRDALRLT